MVSLFQKPEITVWFCFAFYTNWYNRTAKPPIITKSPELLHYDIYNVTKPPLPCCFLFLSHYLVWLSFIFNILSLNCCIRIFIIIYVMHPISCICRDKYNMQHYYCAVQTLNYCHVFVPLSLVDRLLITWLESIWYVCHLFIFTEIRHSN